MTVLADADDAVLVARALSSREPAAFGELVRRHQSRVRIFLLRLCRDASRADDLAQDCFLHAWDKLGDFRGDGSFAGWLLRIAWTTFLQHKRRDDRYRDVVELAAHETDTTGVAPVREELNDLDRLLGVLTEEERAVMILSYACGLSHREISDASGLPVGTVKSVIHRGKQKIRDRFEIENRQYG
ncbi:MAG: sigma-70 family RNA polymerase sigma factor [Woeseiaceae bacterium]|nr:sigma-70 family RNA polymerase sigma factor [Woeseiaceae bacterium]